MAKPIYIQFRGCDAVYHERLGMILLCLVDRMDDGGPDGIVPGTAHILNVRYSIDENETSDVLNKLLEYWGDFTPAHTLN